MAGDYASSNGAQLLDGHYRSKCPAPPMWDVLRESVLRWCHEVGLRSVLLELRNLRYRIRQGRTYRKAGLMLMRQTIPQLYECDSRTESNSYIAGIRALKAGSPVADTCRLRIISARWFQAERYLTHSDGTVRHTKAQTPEPPRLNCSIRGADCPS
jgi:hypothetical protein